MLRIEGDAGFYRPKSLSDAIRLKKSLGDKALVVAGGTLAVQLLNKYLVEPEAIISLEDLPLSYVKMAGRRVEIGATTTVAALLKHQGLPQALAEAARSIHGLALREAATVGGNLMAPAPSGDLATALMALDAEVLLRGSRGARAVPLSKFYRGALQYNIRRDELIYAVRVRRAPNFSSFRKFTAYRYSGPTIASVAVGLDLDRRRIRGAAVSVGGLTTHPYRATAAEKALTGREPARETFEDAAQRVADGVSITQGLYSDAYLRRLASVLFVRAVEKVMS
jgi:CO/xanthine dehydrogenase FAD-binding subunit